MKYVKPLNAPNENDSYTDFNSSTGIKGSVVGAKSIEHPMREIVNVIIGAGLTPDDKNLSQLKEAINTLIAAQGIDTRANRSLDNLTDEALDLIAPAGELVFVPHTGFTPAQVQKSRLIYYNGAAVSRTSYARLFKAIGTSFGAGNGSTTFNVPDYRGDFIRGSGGASGNLWERQAGGAPSIAHSHNVTALVSANVWAAGGTSSAMFGGNTSTIASGGIREGLSSLYGAANEIRPVNRAVMIYGRY